MKKFNKRKEAERMLNVYLSENASKLITQISNIDITAEQLISYIQHYYEHNIVILKERLEYWHSAEALDLLERYIKYREQGLLEELKEQVQPEQKVEETAPVKKKRIIVVKKSEKAVLENTK